MQLEVKVRRYLSGILIKTQNIFAQNKAYNLVYCIYKEYTDKSITSCKKYSQILSLSQKFQQHLINSEP